MTPPSLTFPFAIPQVLTLRFSLKSLPPFKFCLPPFSPPPKLVNLWQSVKNLFFEPKTDTDIVNGRIMRERRTTGWETFTPCLQVYLSVCLSFLLVSSFCICVHWKVLESVQLDKRHGFLVWPIPLLFRLFKYVLVLFWPCLPLTAAAAADSLRAAKLSTG